MKMQNVLVVVAGVLTLAACGVSKVSAKSDLSASQGTEPMFNCYMVYLDKSIQENPLYSESFEATPNLKEELRNYGVSPGTGKYFARVVKNSSQGPSDELVLQIGHVDSELTTSAVFKQDSQQQTTLLSIGSDKSLVLSCSLKG